TRIAACGLVHLRGMDRFTVQPPGDRGGRPKQSLLDTVRPRIYDDARGEAADGALGSPGARGAGGGDRPYNRPTRCWGPRTGDPGAVPGSPDPALQRGGLTPRIPMPIQSFDGLANADNLAILGTSPVAPDTNGDVGPNHYVQMINNLFAVYDKTGTRLYGPVA